MRTLLTRMLRIGSDTADDEDARLRKVLVLGAALMVVPAAAAWGAIYWSFGEPAAALSPWIYSVVGLVSLVILARTRAYVPFAAIHFTMFLVLPFTLMWTLGGFVGGSAVALWAWLSPLGARTVGHRRTALLLLVAFCGGFVLSAILRPDLQPDNTLPDAVVLALFVLNIVGVSIITLVLVDASSGGREGSLASMRSLVYRYLSSDVADTVLADPGRQALGGDVAEVTILFADLGGYTTYSAERTPHQVLELLNAAFGAAVPAILAEGGTPVQLPGDAVMAIFGAPRRFSDHATRAARAALDIQRRSLAVARQHPDWPRFRIGVNSGQALVGNIGSDEFRNFTAIGDTVNMAQRFQTLAEPGQVVVGPTVATQLGRDASVEWLDAAHVKGKAEPVLAGVLVSVGDTAARG